MLPFPSSLHATPSRAPSKPSLPRIDAHCSVADLLRWMGANEPSSTEFSEASFLTRRVRSGATLFRAGNRFENLYFVGVGTLKCYQLDDDGYEQALSFAMRGDVVGFDALSMGKHATTAIALEDSIVAVVPAAYLQHMSRTMPELERLLLETTSRELQYMNDTLVQMAAMGAEVRLARFLLHLSQRMEHIGLSARRFRLRMGRRDIASHLGVAHETVSRSFTALAEWGYIRVTQRDVEIIDRAGLYNFQRCTRGSIDPNVERLRCAQSKLLSPESLSTPPLAMDQPCAVKGPVGISTSDAQNGARKKVVHWLT